MNTSGAVEHDSFFGGGKVVMEVEDFFLEALLSVWVREELVVGAVHWNESMLEPVVKTCFFNILGYLVNTLDCDYIGDAEHFLQKPHLIEGWPMPDSNNAFANVGESQLLQLCFVLDVGFHLLTESVRQHGHRCPRNQPYSLRPLVFFLHLNLAGCPGQELVLERLLIHREPL